MNIRQALESWSHYQEDSTLYMELRKITEKLWVVTNRHYGTQILTTDPEIYHHKDFTKEPYANRLQTRPLGDS